MKRTGQFTVGNYLHILNRGAKKLPIYRQKSDLWRLLYNLYYLNSKHVPDNWARELEKRGTLTDMAWPTDWPEKVPLVSILAFTIMPNHFHLIVKEIKEGGLSEFMQKFSMGYTKFINAKYDESGSLFQGGYKAQLVEADEYLRYLAAYVMVKNTFELYPTDGLLGATKNFDAAYEWSTEYPFSSLRNYAGKGVSSILDKNILGEIFSNPSDFKKFAKDCILGRNIDTHPFID